jgi:hypothetical protein
MTLPFVLPGCVTWFLTVKEGTLVQGAQDRALDG